MTVGGACVGEFSSSLFSSSPMNRFAYEGAVGVPMAVP